MLNFTGNAWLRIAAPGAALETREEDGLGPGVTDVHQVKCKWHQRVLWRSVLFYPPILENETIKTTVSTPL